MTLVIDPHTQISPYWKPPPPKPKMKKKSAKTSWYIYSFSAYKYGYWVILFYPDYSKLGSEDYVRKLGMLLLTDMKTTKDD